MTTWKMGAALCEKHNERARIGVLGSYHKTRRAVLDHYGERCVCCGETRKSMLQIDHIHNNGNMYRKLFPKTDICRWLIEHRYPENVIQILCANCNWSKRINKGVCEHVTERQNAQTTTEA
jgi:hypothetical protein